MNVAHRIMIFAFLVLLSCCKPKPTVFYSQVLLLSPDDNANVYHNNISFSWKKFNIFSTRLQVSADANFNTLILDSLCEATALDYNGTSVFNFNTTYYWRIKADPQAGDIFYTDPRKFKIIDTRDSLKGTYTAQIHSIKWNQPYSTDTAFQATVVLSKTGIDKLHVVCAPIGWLPDMLPYPDNNFYHYGDKGLVPVDSAFKSCVYDTLLRKISLEYYSGTVNPGYHYWLTIYK